MLRTGDWNSSCPRLNCADGWRRGVRRTRNTAVGTTPCSSITSCRLIRDATLIFLLANPAKCLTSPSSVGPDVQHCSVYSSEAAMQEPEIVADFGDLNGEAPVWDPDTGTLFWTDCVGLKFCRFQPQTSK